MKSLIDKFETLVEKAPPEDKKAKLKAKSKKQIKDLPGYGKHETPVFIRHCVRAVVKDRGKSVSDAFAICTAGARKSGYITKSNPMRITAKGKKAAKKHWNEPDAKAKDADYEAQLASARKKRKEKKEDSEMTMRRLLEAFELKDRFDKLSGWVKLKQGGKGYPESLFYEYDGDTSRALVQFVYRDMSLADAKADAKKILSKFDFTPMTVMASEGDDEGTVLVGAVIPQ